MSLVQRWLRNLDSNLRSNTLTIFSYKLRTHLASAVVPERLWMILIPLQPLPAPPVQRWGGSPQSGSGVYGVQRAGTMRKVLSEVCHCTGQVLSDQENSGHKHSSRLGWSRPMADGQWNGLNLSQSLEKDGHTLEQNVGNQVTQTFFSYNLQTPEF